MKNVYLDNASTTKIRSEVIEVIMETLQENYGNPSSTYVLGRNAKAIVEIARKQIAKIFNTTSQEIIFTSSATEANNWILRNAVENLKIQRILTSKIEHHSVLHTARALQTEYGIELAFVDLHSNGNLNIESLENILKDQKPTLVSLMYVNNEIGTISDIEKIGFLAQKHNAYFHSDTVQAIGKIPIDLAKIPIDFMVGTAHKFHGPKGVGFLFARKGVLLKPLFLGGSQEKGIRAGTESVHQIAGLVKALEVSYDNLEKEKEYILSLKNYLIQQLDKNVLSYKINGDSQNVIYTIINIQLLFPENITSTILFSLDMQGVFVSRGSACQSGSVSPSHVLKEILPENEIDRPSLRISFSHLNTKEEIDFFIKALKSLPY